MGAQRVVHRKRRVRRADRDVYLQRAHQLRARDVLELVEDRRHTARPAFSTPSGAACGCTPAAITRTVGLAGFGQPTAPVGQLRDRGAHRRCRDA